MAIVFEQKRKIRWFRLVIFITVIVSVLIATYYLFFAPSPRIELIIPPPLKTAEEVSAIDFIDPSAVVRSSAFTSLRDWGNGKPGTGALGRTNPFLPL